MVLAERERREILTRRWERNERCGDAFLIDADAQRDLRFSWNGRAMRDELDALTFTYRYPSTIGTSLFFHGMFEPGEIAFVEAILAQVEAPVVLDIGANIGHHTVRWCRALEKAVCHAFEPVAGNVELLRRNVELWGVGERVIVDERAVSSFPGKAILREADDAAYSTLDPGMPILHVAEYEVPTVSIDAYVRERAIERVDFLKIDVEGMEAAVLAGAERTIERDAPFLLLEISPVRGAEAARNLVGSLLERGYRAYAFTNGVVAEDEGFFDDTVRNYAFVSARRPIAIPTISVSAARMEARADVRIIRRLQAAVNRFTAGATEQGSVVREKQEELERQSIAANERLRAIEELHARIAEREAELGRLHEMLGEKQGELERQSAAAEERLQLIEHLSARNAQLQADAQREREQRPEAAAEERERMLRHIAFQEAMLDALAEEIEGGVSIA